ncbi:MAG: 50S ribosomal protein L24 [Candidatus Hodarchaeota archaeon]
MGAKSKTRDPSKQRRRLYTADSFHRSKMMSARLSKDLQEKYKVKKMPVRTGDVVYITTGDFVGTEGKILTMDTKKRRLGIDGIAREKADKSKVMYKIDASNVVIRRFGKVDRSRKKILERRAKMELEIDEDDITAAEAIEEE